MRLFWGVLLAISVAGVAAASELPGPVADRTKVIRDAVPELMTRHRTPGVSIALIDAKQIAWTEGFGVLRAGEEAPVTPDTIFEACSMSKPLFAYAVMKLVENGQLDLDRPLRSYLDRPYLPEEPLHEKITARMVLAHTTGFPNWRPGGWRSGGKLAVSFEPGTKFGYSGEGFWYLQQVVEQIVGEPLEPWIQRSLLQPLGMNSSSYVWQAGFESRAAQGHTAEGIVKEDRPLYRRANTGFTLYTTPRDYAAFLVEMLTADGSSPHSVRRETIDAMLTPQPVASSRPNESRGLGWALTPPEQPRFVYHSGSNGTGFRCHSRFDRQTGSGIVIMTNGVGGAALCTSLIERLTAEFDSQ